MKKLPWPSKRVEAFMIKGLGGSPRYILKIERGIQLVQIEKLHVVTEESLREILSLLGHQLGRSGPAFAK
jgi:hypothetical protein